MSVPALVPTNPPAAGSWRSNRRRHDCPAPAGRSARHSGDQQNRFPSAPRRSTSQWLYQPFIIGRTGPPGSTNSDASAGGSWWSTSTQWSTTTSGSSATICRSSRMSGARRLHRTTWLAFSVRGTQIESLMVPRDCRDGFLSAYWHRPSRYLDAEARRCMSGLQALDPIVVERGMAALRADLESGRWQSENAGVLDQQEFDGGWRLIFTP